MWTMLSPVSHQKLRDRMLKSTLELSYTFHAQESCGLKPSKQKIIAINGQGVLMESDQTGTL